MAAVTVVIATCERPGLLSEAIGCLLSQTFADWEAVVVDASDDEYELTTDDPRVRYLREMDHGVAGVAEARNLAVSVSDSKYIAYLDDDELYYPTKLEVMLNYLEYEARSEFAYHDIVVSCIRRTPHGYRHIVVPRRHWHPPGDPNEAIRHSLFIAGLQVVHTRNLFDRAGGFVSDRGRGIFRGEFRAPADRYDEDADLFRRCGDLAALKHLPLQLGEYRVHGGNVNSWGIDYDRIVREKRLEKEFY